MKDVTKMFNQFLYSMTAEELTEFNKISGSDLKVQVTNAYSQIVSTPAAVKITKSFKDMLKTLSKDELIQFSSFGDSNIRAMISDEINLK